MQAPDAIKRKIFTAIFAGLAALFIDGTVGSRVMAAAPALEVPVACEVGSDCFIQFYVDRDTSPEVADYRCGALSYDGHKGTDFRLVDLPAMNRGTVVLAAAAGTVRAIRDGGGSGSIIGRNTFQRPRDEALKMLDSIVKIYQGKDG